MVRLCGPRTLMLLTVVTAAGSAVASVSSFGSSTSGTSQQVQSMPDRLAQMRHHFTQVGLVYEAVIRGDLPGLGDPAKRLADFEQPLSVAPATAQYVLAIQAAAKRAVDARDLPSAASATASMLLSCGNCHRVSGTMPVPTTPKRPDVGGLVGHMLEHQRAVDEMLEGLFIPSESQWIRGATRFRAAPLQRQSMPRDRKLTRDILLAEERVHQLADRAIKAEGWSDRAEIYAQVLSTCANCHSLHKVVWGPGKSPI